VTGIRAGSALMRDLDHAETLLHAAVGATSRPVTLKMRLGWDSASQNAPELASRAEAAGIRAITVHARTRCQFYAGAADWKAVRTVKAATSLPVIVNGDVLDGRSALTALSQSGADAVMVGRGMYGQPWQAGRIEAVLAGRTPPPEPDPARRFAIVMEHLADSLRFYGDGPGLKLFRKHLGWYVERSPFPARPETRRAAKSRLCQLDSVADIESGLRTLWLAE
jgi:nifR3 family TIM-barrel protein